MAGTTDVTDQGEEIYLVVRTRSVLACFIHWVLVLSVIVMVVTGLYIAYPLFYYGRGEAYQAFAMANMRELHFIFATIVIACLAGRFFLSFTPSCNKDILQFMPTPKNIVNALKLAFNFGTGEGEHAHYRFINPLGGIGVFMMAVSLLVMASTGFLLYVPKVSPDSIFYSIGGFFTAMLGGLQMVRLIHHLTMYFLLFFVTIHIYMQVWKAVYFTESDMSSIIGGYKIFPKRHIGHFADYYGIYLDEEAPSRDEMNKVSTPMKEAPG